MSIAIETSGATSDVSVDTELNASVAARLESVLIFSLIDFLLWGSSYWYTNAGLMMLCVPAIVFKRVRYSPWLWVGIGAVLTHKIAVNWALADNHKYVMTYWALAIGAAMFVRVAHRIEVLASNACWILGLSMLFATFWKVISPEYVSGAFFEILLITDRRFDGTVALLTDLTYGQLLENQARVKVLREGYMNWINPESQQLHTTPMVHMLAFVATWWTVFIEGAKGILFVLPWNGPWVYFLRNLTLTVFCFTTYQMAPVPGFGCSLACMGMATCIQKGDYWYYTYQVIFLYVILCFVAAEPFRELLLTL